MNKVHKLLPGATRGKRPEQTGGVCGRTPATVVIQGITHTTKNMEGNLKFSQWYFYFKITNFFEIITSSQCRIQKKNFSHIFLSGLVYLHRRDFKNTVNIILNN